MTDTTSPHDRLAFALARLLANGSRPPCADGSGAWTSDDRDKLWYHVPYFKLSGALANYALTEVSVRVRLHAGPNRLLFKLYNGVDLMFFNVVLRQ